MRAAAVAGPGEARVERAAVPASRPGEVLVRIEGCGVCASSLPLWEGRPWFAYPHEPGAPGHEGWGYELDSGRRVALLSYHAFAEYDVAPAEHVVELPAELDGLPFPGEAFGCAVSVVRRAGVDHGERVAIVGVGFLGSAVAQLCERAGAEVVRVRRDSIVDEAFSLVIEAAGTQAALDTASRLVGERGKLVLAGYHQDGPRTVDLQSWNWRGIDVVNAHERDPGRRVAAMRDAVQLVAAGDLDVEGLVTHRFPLERIGDAFEAARRREPGFVKAWVAP
jgi:threonine dehydrogenase-like Zn-dependent dehydrogenase